jgi:hypothetical protein
MVNGNVLARVFLTAITTTCNVLVISYSDHLPWWASACIVGFVTATASVGIIPPQVDTFTVRRGEIAASEPKGGVVTPLPRSE